MYKAGFLSGLFLLTYINILVIIIDMGDTYAKKEE